MASSSTQATAQIFKATPEFSAFRGRVLEDAAGTARVATGFQRKRLHFHNFSFIFHHDVDEFWSAEGNARYTSSRKGIREIEETT